jgi:tetratricopeptide (TPR) repeat protein
MTCLVTSGYSQVNYIKKGDELFLLMKYEEAIVWYNKEPENPVAQYKISAAYVCMADMASGDVKKQHIANAELAARKSLKLNPDLSEGHTWLAASLGHKALFEGSKTKVLLCNEVKSELEKATKLNPNNHLAYSIMGTFYRALGNVSWVERKLAEVFIGTLPSGGYKESEAAFLKAIKLSPKTVRNWYELGLLYSDWDKEDLVIKIFTEGSKLQPEVESDKKRIKAMKEYLDDNE